MENKLESILSILPSIENIVVKGEADYYGISYLVAKKLKLPYIPRSLSSWQHGWIVPEIKYSEQLTGGQNNSTKLVALMEHEVFLKKEGVKSKAVGMPFVYVEDVETQKIERQKNTLLVMPPHSLPYTNHTWNEESYAKKINELKNKFDLIVVCLHQTCIDKGLWVSSFEKYDIPWIIGANALDKNGLIRMYRIFNAFEFMTTNAIGSHVAYAAYCGCKVSIYGEYAEFSKEDYADTPVYKEFPFLLEYNLRCYSYEQVHNNFPFLFSPPDKAKIRIEWAERQLGKANKVCSHDLAKLLGWGSLYKQFFFSIKTIHHKIKNRIRNAIKCLNS
jgi:hypothetical protein